MKLRSASRAAVLSCAALFALTAPANAQRAPIVYAGQGAQSVDDNAPALPGGSDNSYGYGRAPARGGAVIDLRRPTSGRVTPVVAEQPVPLAIEDEAPQSRSVAEPAPQQAAGEGGWLEQERVGPPYQANGQWYVPTPEPGYSQTGTASWYGPQFHGQRTASGEVFDQDALTAAHPTLPIPSIVQVTNLENGREVIVRVNDRGPFVGDRLIDMSRGAADALGFQEQGQARVHVRYLGPAPRRVNADGSMAPASPPSPPPAAAQQDSAEEGPSSLLPPVSDTSLAGGPDDDAPYAPAARTYAAPASGNFFVQVGAYSDLSNAHRVRDTVGAAGPVVVDIRQTGAGELFRVRVGPWNSREEADDARRQLAALGYGDAVVAAR
ncbi:MAG: septal ring lytic transglycosylase RlpA family protein [Hyphomonadaceae bacterium]|nr:septal ring lytic transglycosylase RlpA family protein [Hyphomonadaceae bacterium]